MSMFELTKGALALLYAAAALLSVLPLLRRYYWSRRARPNTVRGWLRRGTLSSVLAGAYCLLLSAGSRLLFPDLDSFWLAMPALLSWILLLYGGIFGGLLTAGAYLLHAGRQLCRAGRTQAG